MKKIAAIFVALATTFTGVAPVHAFPGMPALSITQAKMPGVEDVRDRRWIKRNSNRHNWDRQSWRGHDRRDYRRDRYSHWRRDDHYRRNYGGAIIGGLAAGAIIGSIVNAQPRRSYAGNSHTSWCYNRYRSYRAYDNTYQPYNGGRRQCVSPY